METLTYPRVRRNELLWDESFGTKVPDPYRWLEEFHSPEIKSFISAQSQLTQNFVQRGANRSEIEQKLLQYSHYSQFTCPIKRGCTYFWCEKPAGDERNSLLYQTRDLLSPGKLLFTPDAIALHQNVKIASYSISPHGTYASFELQNSKTEKSEIHFWRCNSREPMLDKLVGLPLSSVTWSTDETGLFYTIYCTSRSDDAMQMSYVNRKRLYLKYHCLGTEQEHDLTCYRWDVTVPNIFTEVSGCGEYLLVSEFNERLSKNRLYYYQLANLTQKEFLLVPIVHTMEARYTYVTNHGSKFIFLTNCNAPTNKLIQIDVNKNNCSDWDDLVPCDPESKLEHAIAVNSNQLIISRLVAGKSCVTIHNATDGSRLRDVQLPVGRITHMTADSDNSTFFLSFTSFNVPCQIVECNLQANSHTMSVFRESEIHGVNPEDFEVKQVFYTSHDGTKIPMFLVHSKDLVFDARAPCKLTAFGGFGLANTPSYSANNLLFLKHFGGVLAVAGIRGGGEYGQRWHDAAREETKQSSFDDFIAAAEYLLHHKYSSTDRLFIEGRENGGLVVLVSAIQRPDLFGAVVAENPVCDMLRFFKFSSTARWLDEYGNPYHEKSFKHLLSYSPVHTCHKLRSTGTRVPAFLIITDPKASKVEPVHSFKILACLQHETAHMNYTPVLNWIRNESNTDLDQCVTTWMIIQTYLSLNWIK